VKVRTLVVDDEQVVRLLICRVMKATNMADFEFIEARDGEEGLEKFDPGSVDLILLDWNMPHMNGLAFADRIRRMPNTKHIPIVMVTSEGSLSKMMEAADNVGINAYIVKPFTGEDMVLRIQPLLAEIAEHRRKSKGLLGRLFGAQRGKAAS